MDKFVVKLTKGATVAAVDVVPKPQVVAPISGTSSVDDQQNTTASSGRRSYQKAWKKTYNWIQYDESVDKVFCGTCKEGMKIKAALPTATIGDKSAILAFVTEGFSTWKKAISRFQTHEKSAVHAAATIACASVAQGVNVCAQLSVGKLKEMKDARVSLLKIISTIRFLAMQGLALRGHTDEKSNFMQLLLLRSQDVPQLRTWLERSKYKWTSHDIMNEILSLLAKQVERNILELIKNSEYFAIIADETADISVKEQMSICLRVVDESFKIHELFMGFYETAVTNADTLFEIIQDVLMRFSLPIHSCRGQCYDGAANVSGEVSGVQARFRDVEPRAIYVHCTAHTLNLVVQDSMQRIEKIRDFLMLMRELITFVRNSPKRLAIFKSFQDDDSKSLRPFCPTRWCLRIVSLTMLESNYQMIITFLRDIHLTGKGDAAAKANGFLSKLLQFETYYFTSLMISVFSKVEILNADLQSTSLHFQMAQSKIDTITTAIEVLRREGYSAIWEKSVSRAHELDLEEPNLPRTRKLPRRLDDRVPLMFSKLRKITTDRYLFKFWIKLRPVCEIGFSKV